MRVSEREAGDVAELDRRAKSERNALQRDRFRAVLLALEGKKAVAIAKTLSRSRRSVQDWVYAYRDGGIATATAGSTRSSPSRVPVVRPSCRVSVRRS
jgi:transposase